jgi:hypothetical protein
MGLGCPHCRKPVATNIIESVVVDTEERVVAAPCTLSGCHYEDLARQLMSMATQVEEGKADLAAEVESGNLHRDLNRRAAEALGKPFAGEGSSWHDIPDQIAHLKEGLREMTGDAKSLRAVYEEERDKRRKAEDDAQENWQSIKRLKEELVQANRDKEALRERLTSWLEWARSQGVRFEVGRESDLQIQGLVYFALTRRV